MDVAFNTGNDELIDMVLAHDSAKKLEESVDIMAKTRSDCDFSACLFCDHLFMG